MILGIWTGRVQEGEQAHHSPNTSLICLCNSDRSNAALAKLRHVGLNLLLQGRIATTIAFHKLQQHLWSTFAGLEAGAAIDLLAGILHGALSALDDRIEWKE